MKNQMRLTWFPVNQRYMVTMGDHADIPNLSIVSVSPDAGPDIRSFATRKEAVEILATCGLQVSRAGIVT